MGNAAVEEWEGPRLVERREILSKGQVPMLLEAAKSKSIGTYLPPAKAVDTRELSPDLDTMAMAMGQGVGSGTRIMPAEEIVKEMVQDAVEALSHGATFIVAAKSR